MTIRKHEEEVATAMARREDKKVRQYEQDIFNACRVRRIQAEMEAIFVERTQWMTAKEADLEAQQSRSPRAVCPDDRGTGSRTR